MNYSKDKLNQLEDFFLNAPMGLVVTDIDGKVIFWNNSFESLAGETRYLPNKTSSIRDRFSDFNDMLTEIDRSNERTLNSFKTLIHRKSGGSCEVIVDVCIRNNASFGAIFYWFVRPKINYSLPSTTYLSSSPSADFTVEDVYTWGAKLNDDSEHLLSSQCTDENQLRELYELLNDFFDYAPVGVHFVGFNGAILRANNAELKLLGYENCPNEYIGHHVRKIHSNKVVVEDLLRRLVEGEPVINFKAKLVRQDGGVAPVIIYSGLRLKDGKFENTRCFLFHDHENGKDEGAGEILSWPRD